MTRNLLQNIAKGAQLLVFILLPSIMFAPPIPPNPGGSTPVTPIDTGVLFLLVVGLFYGIFRLINAKKNLA
tara:strand:+ start:38458 stop:38670 length:213 start_codon:yes stop_codon:yes gene_type:complete